MKGNNGGAAAPLQDGFCHDQMQSAAENLLRQCGDVSAGDRVLIVREPAHERFYGARTAEHVFEVALRLGLRADQCVVDFVPEATDLPHDLIKAMQQVDLTVFFARIGDQSRFMDMPAGARAVVSYALDDQALASPFGTADHQFFLRLQRLVEQALSDAEIRVTCPLGTELQGRTKHAASGQDVSIRRFPMLMPAPVPADTFSGRVAPCGFLAGTGSRYYDPYGVSFDGPVMADVSEGRLTGFQGAVADVARANAHYDFVSARFGIDRNAVHSWHAGIHPACRFRGAAQDDLMRWSGSAFGNPRLLHFHTCGAYAPGEICWSVLDPTVTVGGVALWDHGRLRVERIEGGPDLLAQYPEAARLFDDPVREVGLD